MKKMIFTFAVAASLFVSCGDSKKEEVKTVVEPKVETVKEETAPVKEETVAESTSDADQFALGEKLFSEKTCVSCHQLDAKVVGPAIKEIAKVYAEKGGDLVKFLKGNEAPIVDTDPGMVAIMKANIDGFLKDLSDEEINALATYIKGAK